MLIHGVSLDRDWGRVGGGGFIGGILGFLGGGKRGEEGGLEEVLQV